SSWDAASACGIESTSPDTTFALPYVDACAAFTPVVCHLSQSRERRRHRHRGRLRDRHGNRPRLRGPEVEGWLSRLRCREWREGCGRTADVGRTGAIRTVRSPGR